MLYLLIVRGSIARKKMRTWWKTTSHGFPLATKCESERGIERGEISWVYIRS